MRTFHIRYFLDGTFYCIAIKADSELVALNRFFKTIVACLSEDEYSSFHFDKII